MLFLSCDNSRFGSNIEFAEENDFGYKHRTITIHLDKAGEVLGVTLYTFRYGRVLWLRKDQHEEMWLFDELQTTKFVRGIHLKIFISLVGAIGNPDDYFLSILDDLKPCIDDIYLYELIQNLPNCETARFSPKRYLDAKKNGSRIKLNLPEKVKTYFLKRKNKKIEKYVPILFPQWTAKALEQDRN